MALDPTGRGALAPTGTEPVAGARWHLRRLRAMSTGEIGARVAREVRHRVDDLEWRAAPGLWRRRWSPPPLREGPIARPLGFMTAERARILTELDPAGAAGIVARADAVLTGDTSALGYAVTVSQLSGRDLAFDPVSDYVWPNDHGKRLDFRDAPANPKTIWELNRCQELPVLAAASLVSGDRRYEEAAASTLLQWLEHQVPGRGVAWANGFEAGIRAISLALAYDALAARRDLEDRLREPVIGSLWQHASWIERDPSTHSSANNHRVGELVGLLAVARLAPELREAERWTSAALDALRREASVQILPDGAGAEQAFAYTLFVVDLLLVAVALLDATGCNPPDEMLDALERAGHAVWAQLGRPEEEDPTYGDDDDGRAVRLDGFRSRLGRGVAASICARTGSTFARTVAERLDPAACWTFGVEGRDRFERTAPAELPGSVLLKNAGLAVLRRGRARVTVDAGPLGYLSLAAHGHADALAVTLSADGADLIVDPGSGTYFGRAAAIRNAFRGTGFHATVLVDGKDQSSSGGPFLWSRHADSWFHRVDLTHRVVIAEHDGYLGDASPVRHRRAVIVLKSGDVLVYDRVEGEGEHTASVRWPLHESLSAEAVALGEARAEGPAGTGLLVMTTATSPGSMSVAHGQRHPFEGWSSPRLEQLVPAPLVKWDVTFRGKLDAVTLLSPITAEAERPQVDLFMKGEGKVAEIAVKTSGRTQTIRLDLDDPSVDPATP